jgi:hypothetical protein
MSDDTDTVQPVEIDPLVEAVDAAYAEAGFVPEPGERGRGVDFTEAIYNLVTASRVASEAGEPYRAMTMAHVVRFAWPALRLAPAA